MCSSMVRPSQKPITTVLKRICLSKISEAGARSFHLSGSSSEACLCHLIQVLYSLHSFSADCNLLHANVIFPQLFGGAFEGRPGFLVPHLLYPDNVDPNMLLLKKEYAWHIGGALPHHEMEQWRLLYHSSLHGLSFNTFLGNIS